MELTRENVLNTLGKIIEPDLKNDLVSLNLIDELDLSANKISLTVQISNPALHARKRMQEAIEFNLKRIFGDDVSISCVIKGMSTESRSARRKSQYYLNQIFCN